MTSCRLDVSEFLSKSSVSSARLLSRSEINFMRLRKKRLNLSFRVDENDCQSIGQLVQLMQSIRKSNVRLHVRVDLSAMTENPSNKRIGKNLKKMQFICIRFKISASSRQLLTQTLASPYGARPSRRQLQKLNSFRSTVWISYKACLSMKWLSVFLSESYSAVLCSQ